MPVHQWGSYTPPKPMSRNEGLARGYEGHVQGPGTDYWSVLPPVGTPAGRPGTSYTSGGGGGSTPGTGQQVARVPSLPPPAAAQTVGRSAEWARQDKLRGEAIAGIRGMFDAPTPPVAMPEDDPRASALAFGRAKDRIGKQRLAAVQSFQDVMGGRGFTGSTVEGGGVGEILSGGLSEIGDVSLAEAQDTVKRKRQLTDMAAEREEARRQMALRSLAEIYTRMGAVY